MTRSTGWLAAAWSVGWSVGWLARCLGVLVSKRGCVVQRLYEPSAHMYIQVTMYTYTCAAIYIFFRLVFVNGASAFLFCHNPYFRTPSYSPMHRGPLYSTGARPYTVVMAFCVAEAVVTAVVAGGRQRAARREDTTVRPLK